jgi:predicted Zn-dependent protease
VCCAFLRQAVAVFVLAVLVTGPALAHDDPDHQVAELSAAIERSPRDANLLVQRAELHRFRRDWQAGLADLQAARELDPALDAVDLAVAELTLDAGNTGAALPAIGRFLARRPDHAKGHLVRARILLRDGRGLDAAAEFSRGIALAASAPDGSSLVQPDDYLDRAKALATAGADHVDEAVRGLDEGIVALGRPITLELLAIELEEKRGRVDEALARLAAVEARANRKETWMARRADLLASAGRRDDAVAAWRDALAAIDRLPPRTRESRATQDLAASIRGRLDPSSPPANDPAKTPSPATAATALTSLGATRSLQ